MTDEIQIVGHDAWLEARRALLEKEKAFTRLRDDLARHIQEMPAEEITKAYTFEGPDGPVTLEELFGSRDQLIVYHFMFGPDWEEGCKSCSILMDGVAPAAVHIRDRGVAFVLVSRGPLARILTFRDRMGWPVRWVSSLDSDFNTDFGVSVTEATAEAKSFSYNYETRDAPAGTELPGLSVFRKDAEGRIFHTYSTYARGLDGFISAYRLLDVVPRGRNEQDLAFGMEWVRLRDRYVTEADAPGGCCH